MKKMIVLLILLISVTINFAGDSSRKGTTGADQLLIPIGARGIAIGGAFVANTSVFESIYYNPAGLDGAHRSEAMFNYMSFLADINVSYVAASANLGTFGTLAISFKTLDFGDIPVTTVESPDGTGSTYSPNYLVGGLTFSKVITDRVAVGFNLKVISETILNSSAVGFGLDFGVQYSFGENFKLGATVMNIGSNMSYTGNDLQQKTSIPGSGLQGGDGLFEILTEEFQLPSYFELSVAYTLALDEQNGIILGTRFRNNNVLEDQMSYGLEYGFMNTLFLRGGYDMSFKNNSESIYGLTFGAGVSYDLSSTVAVSVDYAYRDVQEFANPNHVFTVILGLQ